MNTVILSIANVVHRDCYVIGCWKPSRRVVETICSQYFTDREWKTVWHSKKEKFIIVKSLILVNHTCTPSYVKTKTNTKLKNPLPDHVFLNTCQVRTYKLQLRMSVLQKAWKILFWAHVYILKLYLVVWASWVLTYHSLQDGSYSNWDCFRNCQTIKYTFIICKGDICTGC